jgi:simple sugar transport system permease protein
MAEATLESQISRWTRLRYRLANFPEGVALISFLTIFIFFSIAADNFLSPIALSNILTFASITGIMVVGVAMLMISGEFDLSVGSTLAVASFIFALSLNAGMNPVLAALFALVVSALLGAINGLILVRTGIPSFIITLGTLLAYRGIARAIGGGTLAAYQGEPLAIFTFLNGAIPFINDLSEPPSNFRVSLFWFIVIAVVAGLVLRRTRYGNWVYATGGNPGAALAQGVTLNRVKVMNFMLTGFLAGVAGIVQFAHRTSVDPLRGFGLELIAVAACVIGGVKLSGGYGTIFGAVVGILLLQMLEQGLVLMSVPVQIFQAVAGTILILAVISNTYLSRES